MTARKSEVLKPLAYRQPQLPDPKGFEDCIIVYVNPAGTRTPYFSDGTTWAAIGTGGGGGGGAINFTDLLDKATADLPGINGPLATALGLKAALASPTFSGTPTAPTPISSDNSNLLATTSFVQTVFSALATGLVKLKGSIDASANPNYPAATAGDSYMISAAGKVGGASGKSVDVSDMAIATANNAGGTEGSVGTSWVVIEHNLVGAALQSLTLAQFASTSSSQFGGIMSDKTGFTGGGIIVFNKAPAFTADPITAPGGYIVAKQSSSTTIDFNKGKNFTSLTSNTSVTFANGSQDGETMWIVTTDGTDRVVTWPGSTTIFSMGAQANLGSTTTFPANKTFYIYLEKTASGAVYLISGEPVLPALRTMNLRLSTGTAVTRIVELNAAAAKTIVAIYAKLESGTSIDCKLQIGGVDITGCVLTGITTGSLSTGNASAANGMVVGNTLQAVTSNPSGSPILNITIAYRPLAL